MEILSQLRRKNGRWYTVERLTDRRLLGDGFYQPKNKEERREILYADKPTYEEIYKRLGEYENRESHGRYIMDEFGDSKCSVCGEKYLNVTQNYCPNCGAKMDLEGE